MILSIAVVYLYVTSKVPAICTYACTRRKILKVFYRFIYAVRGSTVGRLPAAISFSRVVSKVFITARITNILVCYFASVRLGFWILLFTAREHSEKYDRNAASFIFCRYSFNYCFVEQPCFASIF